MAQKLGFYETGRVIDPNDGAHARTDRWPERAGDQLAEVEADLSDDCLAFLSAPASPDASSGPESSAPDPAEGPAVLGRLPATGTGVPVLPLLGLAGTGLAGLALLRRRAGV